VTDVYGRSCPCGSGAGYDACCGLLHRGERQADGRGVDEVAIFGVRVRRRRLPVPYLAPRTRPADVTIDAKRHGKPSPSPGIAAGGIDDEHGEVSSWLISSRRPSRLDARAQHFERRAGRWFYVDGVVE